MKRKVVRAFLIAITFLVVLILWAGILRMLLGGGLKAHLTITALLGLGLLVITSVSSWDDI